MALSRAVASAEAKAARASASLSTPPWAVNIEGPKAAANSVFTRLEVSTTP